MKKLLPLFASIVVLAGCAKEPPPPMAKADATPTPSLVVTTMYDALNHHDSARYFNSMCQSRRENYAKRPEYIGKTLEYWDSTRATVTPLSEKIDGTIATVTVHVVTTGKHLGDTTLTAQLYKEDGGWKFGHF